MFCWTFSCWTLVFRTAETDFADWCSATIFSRPSLESSKKIMIRQKKKCKQLHSTWSRLAGFSKNALQTHTFAVIGYIRLTLYQRSRIYLQRKISIFIWQKWVTNYQEVPELADIYKHYKNRINKNLEFSVNDSEQPSQTVKPSIEIVIVSHLQPIRSVSTVSCRLAWLDGEINK